MSATKYVVWQEGDAWMGYLLDNPDFWGQGRYLEDLIAELGELARVLSGERVAECEDVGALVQS